jgi:hypothetical protein
MSRLGAKVEPVRRVSSEPGMQEQAATAAQEIQVAEAVERWCPKLWTLMNRLGPRGPGKDMQVLQDYQAVGRRVWVLQGCINKVMQGPPGVGGCCMHVCGSLNGKPPMLMRKNCCTSRALAG